MRVGAWSCRDPSGAKIDSSPRAPLRLDKERGTPVESCSLPQPIQPPFERPQGDRHDPTDHLILAALALAIAVPRRRRKDSEKIKDSGSITIGHRDARSVLLLDDKQQPVVTPWNSACASPTQ